MPRATKKQEPPPGPAPTIRAVPVWTATIDPNAPPVDPEAVDRALVELLLSVAEERAPGKGCHPGTEQDKKRAGAR
jgi:hypothetical protein